MVTQIPTLYLLLAAVIGVFIGLLVSSLFSSRESRSKTDAPRELMLEGFGEIARVWYSPVGKKILIEMEGGYYKEFKDLSKDQKSKVVRMVELMGGWIVEFKETDMETPMTEQHQAYEEIIPEKQVEPDEPWQPVMRETAYEEEIVEAEAIITEDKSTNPFFSEEEEEADLVSVLQESLDEDEPLPETEEPAEKAHLTITQQISAILDEMLMGTELEGKGIRLWENPDHGVDVFVGSEKFEGIDAVPYPQVRQVIRDAVVRWEEENESQQRIND